MFTRCDDLIALSYFRLFGSYESLMHGHGGEAMEDFTGGITLVLDLAHEDPIKVYSICCDAFKRGALMCASIHVCRFTIYFLIRFFRFFFLFLGTTECILDCNHVIVV